MVFVQNTIIGFVQIDVWYFPNQNLKKTQTEISFLSVDIFLQFLQHFCCFVVRQIIGISAGGGGINLDPNNPPDPSNTPLVIPRSEISPPQANFFFFWGGGVDQKYGLFLCFLQI